MPMFLSWSFYKCIFEGRSHFLKNEKWNWIDNFHFHRNRLGRQGLGSAYQETRAQATSNFVCHCCWLLHCTLWRCLWTLWRSSSAFFLSRFPFHPFKDVDAQKANRGILRWVSFKICPLKQCFLFFAEEHVAWSQTVFEKMSLKVFFLNC